MFRLGVDYAYSWECFVWVLIMPTAGSVSSEYRLCLQLGMFRLVVDYAYSWVCFVWLLTMPTAGNVSSGC